MPSVENEFPSPNFSMDLRRTDFVVFSDDWGRHPSSNQHLFARISRRHRVLWVNTIGLRAPTADSFTLFRGLEKLREWMRPLRQVHENLWILAPMMLPVAGEGILARINRRLTAASIRRAMTKLGIHAPVLWASIPTAADYIGKLGESSLLYYVTDDYAHWPGANAGIIRRQDQELTGRADIILTCNEYLAETHRTAGKAPVVLPHAVDFDHFSRSCPEPEELKSIPHPRVCFFGLIYEKIDLDSMRELATRRPDVQLVLIGLIKTNIDRLKALSNVHVVGPKPYEELPAWLGAMDVFVVPYVADEETKAKGPLKIRECLAVGKPTVARRIPDLEGFADVIHLYDGREELIEAVSHAIGSAADGSVERMRDRVRSETWEARTDRVTELLDALDGNAVSVSHDQPDWNEFLARHPEAETSHDPRWAAIMQEVYGNRACYLTAKRDGRIVGTLQLVEQKSRLFGSHWCSLPYFDAAGILVDDESAAQALLQKARQLLTASKVQWIELRHRRATDEALPSRADKIDLRLMLPGTVDELWNRLEAKVRNQVRKAQSMNLTLVSGGSELLDEFQAVYVRNMRDLGSPPHGRRFFERILARLPEASRIFVVRSGDVPAAAAFTLTYRATAHVPWAASDWRLKHLCSNMLLYWSMLSASIEQGSRLFDFGRSTRDSGTHRFKKQWGAEEHPLVWEFLLPPHQTLPELRPDSTKYRLLVDCWRRLPVSLARALGPALIARLS